jgi:streptogramin lyase
MDYRMAKPFAPEPGGAAAMKTSLLAGVVLSSSLLAPAAPAQAQDQVVVFVNGDSQAVLRFDRRLSALGETPVPQGVLSSLCPASLDGAGQIWVGSDRASETKLLRLGSDGQLLSTTELGHHPADLVLAADGTAQVFTRTGLSALGPLFVVSASGALLGSSGAGPSLFEAQSVQSLNLALTPSGELWMAADDLAQTLLVRVDPADGAVLHTLPLPPGAPEAGLVAAPDGTLWNVQTDATLVHTDGASILSSFVIEASASIAGPLAVDAAGDLWALHHEAAAAPLDGVLRHFAAADGAILGDYPAVASANGFALGASGEEAFAVDNGGPAGAHCRLVKLNLVSGVRSSVPLPVTQLTAFASMPKSDPTGFIYANVVDQAGDADGDGAANRREVLAGTSPYDALSRPGGPKVYVSFEPVSNAIALTFTDPDGLLDTAGGIDPASIELLAGPHGDVFPLLLHFVTSVQLSAGGTSGTIVFGGLPLGDGLKLPLEARVADVTGAVGWDWAVTPPGDL